MEEKENFFLMLPWEKDMKHLFAKNLPLNLSLDTLRSVCFLFHKKFHFQNRPRALERNIKFLGVKIKSEKALKPPREKERNERPLKNNDKDFFAVY